MPFTKGDVLLLRLFSPTSGRYLNTAAQILRLTPYKMATATEEEGTIAGLWREGSTGKGGGCVWEGEGGSHQLGVRGCRKTHLQTGSFVPRWRGDAVGFSRTSHRDSDCTRRSDYY